MKYNRIGIDIDDVVRSFMDTVYSVYLDIYPEHAGQIKPINGWSLTETFPIGEKIYEFIFEKYPQRIFYEDARVYDEAGKGLDVLHDSGYQLIAITSQRPKCAPYTQMFFDYYELPFDETHIQVLDDTFVPKDKTTIPVDIMIDDNYDTIMRFYNKNIEVVCQARPWNVKYHSELQKLGIPIVRNFIEFVDYIQEQEKNYVG